MAKTKKSNSDTQPKNNEIDIKTNSSESNLDEIMSSVESIQGCTQAMFSYGLVESLAMEDIEQRILYIDGTIDSSIFREINAFIIKFNAADVGIPTEARIPIKIVISSRGGVVLDGLGTIECIKNSETPVIAICTSYACSMAFYIFASAHYRFATSNAAFLNHDGSMYIDDSMSKVEDTIVFHKRITERLNKMLTLRSKYTAKELEDTKRIESWIFGDEAKDLGIVDGIIGEDISFEDIFGVSEKCSCGECDG